jgi:hypothetical protein
MVLRFFSKPKSTVENTIALKIPVKETGKLHDVSGLLT